MLNIDIHAVLDGFDSNDSLQGQVAAAEVSELEEWIPRLIEALRGRDSDPAKLARSMDALFSALAARDLFLAALLTKIIEVIPVDRKVLLRKSLARGSRYPQVIRDLHAAIENGDIVREIDAETQTVTFRRKDT